MNGETFRNYASRFAALMNKFNSNGKSMRLPESAYALLLLSNAYLDDSQLVSVLSAATASVYHHNNGRSKVFSIIPSSASSTSTSTRFMA